MEPLDGEVALEEARQAEPRGGPALERERRRDADPGLHLAAVRRNGKALDEDAVGAARRHEDRVAAHAYDLLVGLAHLTAPAERGLALLAVDPERQPRDDGAGRKLDLRARLALRVGRVAEDERPLQVSGRGVRVERAVDVRRREREPFDRTADLLPALVLVELAPAVHPPRPEELRRGDRGERHALDQVVDLSRLIGVDGLSAREDEAEEAAVAPAAHVAHPQHRVAVAERPQPPERVDAARLRVRDRAEHEVSRRRGLRVGEHEQRERACGERPDAWDAHVRRVAEPRQPQPQEDRRRERDERRERQQSEQHVDDRDDAERDERKEHDRVEERDAHRHRVRDRDDAHMARVVPPDRHERVEVRERHEAGRERVPDRRDRIEEGLGAHVRRRFDAHAYGRKYDAEECDEDGKRRWPLVHEGFPPEVVLRRPSVSDEASDARDARAAKYIRHDRSDAAKRRRTIAGGR